MYCIFDPKQTLKVATKQCWQIVRTVCRAHVQYIRGSLFCFERNYNKAVKETKGNSMASRHQKTGKKYADMCRYQTGREYEKCLVYREFWSKGEQFGRGARSCRGNSSGVSCVPD